MLTDCAACAAKLAHDAPRCVRCKTRYCDATCQHDHWRRGHKQICKKIHRGGNAEQYHADKKYKEAAAVAVEKCADDTKGQTCYICMEGSTKEGLVRGCACGDRDHVASGSNGIAHLSCLARQAKIFVEGAAENKDLDALDSAMIRWEVCALCDQEHHGAVRGALGWACWKTYVGRPETEFIRNDALAVLGRSLGTAQHHEESLVAFESRLEIMKRVFPYIAPTATIMCKDNISTCYDNLGRYDEALALKRELYTSWLRLAGPKGVDTHRAALNLAIVLLRRPEENASEAKSFLGEVLPRAERALGPDHNHTLEMRVMLGDATHKAPDATLDDCREAEKNLKDVIRRYRRRFGDAHPLMGCTTKILVSCQHKIKLLRLRNGYALMSDEEKRKLQEMGGGVIERMIDGKAPSIKEMKAIIRKAGFGVADLVEKSEVEARYREAVVRLGDIAKQDESYTGYFEREEDLK